LVKRRVDPWNRITILQRERKMEKFETSKEHLRESNDLKQGWRLALARLIVYIPYQIGY
jgi:hypothetical protein